MYPPMPTGHLSIENEPPCHTPPSRLSAGIDSGTSLE
jgi:hypothetical protein